MPEDDALGEPLAGGSWRRRCCGWCCSWSAPEGKRASLWLSAENAADLRGGTTHQQERRRSGEECCHGPDRRERADGDLDETAPQRWFGQLTLCCFVSRAGQGEAGADCECRTEGEGQEGKEVFDGKHVGKEPFEVSGVTGL